MLVLLLTAASASAFNTGEHLTYDFSIDIPELNISGKIGSVDLFILERTNIASRIVYHACARITSIDIINSLYPFNSEYHSWFDAETGTPYRIECFVHQGKWTNHTLLTNLPAFATATSNTGIYYDRRNTFGKKMRYPKNSADIITALFTLRTRNRSIPYDFVWINYDRLHEVHFTFAASDAVRVKAFGRKPVPAVEISEKEYFGITAKLADERDAIPLTLTIPALKFAGFSLVAQARLVKYETGQ